MENRIIAILPNSRLKDKLVAVQERLGVYFPIYQMQTEDAVQLAKEKVSNGAKVIISRGMTANYLRTNLDVPVVEIKYDFFHFAYALRKALSITNEVAIIGFIDAYRLAKRAVEFVQGEGEKIHVVILPDGSQIEDNINSLSEIGIKTFVGGNLVVSTAKRKGYNCVLVEADERVVEEAIINAQYELRIHIEQEEKVELIQSIISSTSNGIFALNRNWDIVAANPIALKYLQIKGTRQYGEAIRELFKDSQIIQTIETGEHVTGDLITLGDYEIVMNSSPIVVEKELRGAVIMMQETSHIKDLDFKIRKKQMYKGHVARKTFDDIIGESSAIKLCKKKAIQYAKVDSTILIQGSTGTGKEIFAQSIHNASLRASKPFVAINCAALPPSLLESELFGYVKGAFSGANSEGKAGIFEIAHTGTIFLDEISEASLDVQARLLRVIQEKEITRIGDDKVIPVDVRILTATNRDLLQEISNKKFREDLFYRLSVLELKLPALSERKDDIPVLAKHIAKEISSRMCLKKVHVTSDAIKVLESIPLEGNVRQLSNIIERALVISNFTVVDEDCVIEAVGLNRNNQNVQECKIENIFENATLEDMERILIKRALEDSKGNRQAAADKLGISLSTLWRRLKEMGMTMSN